MARNPTSESEDARFGVQLEVAARDHQFFLVYQPSIDLQTGAFSGVEALLRWRHPERGVLGPDLFMTELSSGDLVTTVGRWTLETACRQGALWHRKGYRFPVSVNVARRQLAGSTFDEDVTSAVATSRINPELLILEFSQSALLTGEPDALGHLRALGVQIAVDDFDLDRSSLEEVAGAAVAVVKLSRHSIATLVATSSAATRLHDLVTQARAVGIRVIASGVEDAAQRELLAAERVDEGQGFLFSRPFEVAEIDRYLEDFSLFSGKPL